MYYMMRHVQSKLRQDEAMMRAVMPTVSANDLEPLTIYTNDRTSERKTLTYSVGDVMRSAMLDTMDRVGASNV